MKPLDKYLHTLNEQPEILQEISIISGKVPIQVVKLGSKEVWLLNFKVGKFIRQKLFKRAMYLTIDDPKDLRMSNGSSAATVRQYDLHIRHFDQSRIIDEGTVHFKLRINPLVIGWFSTGNVFDIFDFKDMKTLKEDDKFRLRIQNPKIEQEREPTLDGEIVRLK